MQDEHFMMRRNQFLPHQFLSPGIMMSDETASKLVKSESQSESHEI